MKAAGFCKDVFCFFCVLLICCVVLCLFGIDEIIVFLFG